MILLHKMTHVFLNINFLNYRQTIFINFYLKKILLARKVLIFHFTKITLTSNKKNVYYPAY